MRYDVAGLGNAIVDALVKIEDDSLLTELSLTRGVMHPVDNARWHEIFSRVRHLGAEVHPGGSCGNTIRTLGLLGARTVFSGQVGDDELGEVYDKGVRDACGGNSALEIVPGGATGKCLSLISAKDAERTMCTDLGVATELPDPGRLTEILSHTHIFHLEGYLFLGGRMAETARRALDIAKEAGATISLDLADPFVVHALKDEMWRILRDYASIAFLNADEASALTGTSAPDAVHAVANEVGTVIVKMGGRGSIVKHHGHTYEVGIHRVDAVDTTGAGDAYAAGYLYGMVRGWAPQRCGDLAARVAALTVGQVGAVVRDRDALKRAVHAVENAG